MAPDSTFIILLCGAVAVLVVWFLHRQSKARQNVRAGYFIDVMALFTDLRSRLMPSGFPRISGQYQGDEFDLQVVPDTLTLRKLPTLWLLVTLPCPQPVKDRFDLMMRPTGVESFSNFAALPHQISLLPGFPSDCAMRTDGTCTPAFLNVVARHLAALNQDRLKELIISPNGLRLVWLIEEADRGRYLIFRDSEMGRTALAAQQLVPLLDALRQLHQDLNNLAQSEAA